MQFPVPDQTRSTTRCSTAPPTGSRPATTTSCSAGRCRWYTDPPAGDGRKVVITDTDHYAPGKGDALWAWKSFLRGHNPILMDFGIIDGVNPPDPSLGVPAYESFEPARYAMGDTLRFAERMNLVEMEPRGDLSSTGYALANPGKNTSSSSRAKRPTVHRDAGGRHLHGRVVQRQQPRKTEERAR